MVRKSRNQPNHASDGKNLSLLTSDSFLCERFLRFVSVPFHTPDGVTVCVTRRPFLRVELAIDVPEQHARTETAAATDEETHQEAQQQETQQQQQETQQQEQQHGQGQRQRSSGVSRPHRRPRTAPPKRPSSAASSVAIDSPRTPRPPGQPRSWVERPRPRPATAGGVTSPRRRVRSANTRSRGRPSSARPAVGEKPSFFLPTFLSPTLKLGNIVMRRPICPDRLGTNKGRIRIESKTVALSSAGFDGSRGAMLLCSDSQGGQPAGLPPEAIQSAVLLAATRRRRDALGRCNRCARASSSLNFWSFVSLCI